MPIRVQCPSCHRIGRVPDLAMGKNIKCPACSHRHVLTDELVIPEGIDVLEPVVEPAPVVRSAPRPEPGLYDLDEPSYVPPARVSKLKPANTERDVDDRSGGVVISKPLLIGGGLAAALLSLVAVAAFFWSSRGTPVGELEARAESPVRQLQVEKTATAPSPVVAGAEEVQPSAPIPPPTPAVVATPRPTPTFDENPGKTLSTAEIVAESEPSVALIMGKMSSGTGFLIAPGLLATNSHVIGNEFISDLDIRFVSADEQHSAPIKAELLYEDPERDLAFLSVKTDLKPLRIAKTYTFRKGEDITVIGNPGMGDGQVLENAISRGVMSTKTKIDNHNFYQLNIAINPGNSGGPVFDSSGRVIGVATLKSSKQESTGFSIPTEDLQAALTSVSNQSSAEAERFRSQHRIMYAAKGLGSSGALMCLIIDLRRALAATNSTEIKGILEKLEPVAAELDQDVAPSLTTEAQKIKNDPLISASVKGKIGEMADNFAKLRGVYAGRNNIDDNQLRNWKQTHKRLINEVWGPLKIAVPEGMMFAFEDHAPSQPTIITMSPQNFGAYGLRSRSRMLDRMPSGPQSPGSMFNRPPGGMITRPPSIRDRMKSRGIR